MAAALTINRRERMGRLKYVTGTVDFDNSYPTGGEAITAAQLGMATVHVFIAAPAGGLMFEYDHANNKLKAIQPTGGGGTNPTTLQQPKVSSGASSASAVDATTPTIVPGMSKEAASTADLSGITGVRFAAWGI